MYDDLDRPPLRAAALSAALEPDGWRVEVLPEAGSTNAVAAERAAAGDPGQLVVVAETQTAGRGRLDRTWVSPPRAGLTMSLLVRPDLAGPRWTWLPLWTGLGVAQALREVAGVQATLKWPNDVLVDGRKVCGILSAVPAEGYAVLGIGLNVTTRAEELPVPEATSLLLAGATCTDRDTLLRAVVRGVAAALSTQSGDAFRALCVTIGAQVRIELPDGGTAEGLAETVDASGRLVVGGTAYGVGDVTHVR